MRFALAELGKWHQGNSELLPELGVSISQQEKVTIQQIGHFLRQWILYIGLRVRCSQL